MLKIDAARGPVQGACAAVTGRGGPWSRDGVIVFGSLTGNLDRVSSAGGTPVALRIADLQPFS